MGPLPDWTLLPLGLFVIPLLLAVGIRRMSGNRPRIASDWVLAWLVAVCWIFAVVVILRQVR